MMLAVAGYVPLPLVVWLGVRGMSAFTFVAIWYVMGAVVHAILRQAQEAGRADGGSGREVRLAISKDWASARPRYLWLAAVCKAEWLLFALAATLAGPVVVTVAFEYWPLLFALLTATSFWRRRMLTESESPRSRADPSEMLALLLVGAVAVTLAVLSESFAADWSASTALGILLAVLATALYASGAVVAQLMGKDQREGASADRTAVSASGNIAARAIAAPFMVIMWVFADVSGSTEAAWTADGLMWCAAAAVLQVLAAWCFQHSNHLARDAHGSRAAQVNSLYYLTPVGALLLLVWLGDTAIGRADLLIVGAAGVVAVNMVMHLDPEGSGQRAHRSGGFGYKALVLTLWAAGAAVLLRDDWLPQTWQVWSVVEYWGMVGAMSTVFVLILSFRRSRLAGLRREMDRLTLSLHHRIAYLGRSGTLSRWATVAAAGRLRRIDTAATPEDLNSNYLRLRRTWAKAIESHGGSDADADLTAGLTDMETLVNLRQQDRSFAEVVVLTMFAAVTVALTLAARPAGDLAPFAGWVHDTASMTVAAAFVFLGFDLADRRREVDAPLLREVSETARTRHGQPAGWRLELSAWETQAFERRSAAALSAVLMAGAVVMLGFKWLA